MGGLMVTVQSRLGIQCLLSLRNRNIRNYCNRLILNPVCRLDDFLNA
jgi:hypothetical protein